MAIALAAITARQPNASTAMRSGAPASVAPSVPMSSASPLTKAKRRGAIQWLASLSIDTNATPAAAPMMRRPAFAYATSGDHAKRRVPTAVSAAPVASTRRGPQRSASIPVGICTAA